MGFWDWIVGTPDTEYVEPVVPPNTGIEKTRSHVRRFTLALEQCTNDDKRPELERNLRYWSGVLALQEGME